MDHTSSTWDGSLTERVGEGRSDLSQKTGQSGSNSPGHSAALRHFTGCSALNSEIWLVTLELTRGRPRVSSTRSQLFRLGGPSQRDVQRFAREVHGFAQRCEITRLGFRRRFDARNRGQRSADAWKMEAILQLLPQVSTTLFTNAEVAHWIELQRGIPPAWPDGGPVSPNQERALEAALFFARPHLGCADTP